MAWANLILYITAPDAERIRNWINNEETVAWIIQAARTGKTYTWRAVDQIDEVRPQEYSIWHKATGLTVPSGRPDVADADVLDPYQGWSQTLERADATGPWFGSGLPGPYTFRFNERGTLASNSLGRSGFSWAGDHYRGIGKAAHPEAKQWWERLKAFVKASATPIPWPTGRADSKIRAYAFEDAYAQIRGGRSVDDNP